MTFKPKIWYPIAAVLCVVNVAAVWFAAAPAEPMHATLHAALAVGFGLWTQRLRQRHQAGELHAGLEPLEFEVSQLRQELGEAQERIDFTERMLVKERDPHRVGRDQA